MESVVGLHQRAELPPNCYVIDLDALEVNTKLLMSKAKSLDLTVYAMTKQLGRAPGALAAMADGGVDGFVAVDMACARPIVGNGHHLGHIGHLVQIPAAEASEAASMKAAYWTVFSPNKAVEASKAASQLGVTQDLLVRIYGPGDEFYAGHEGGVFVDDLDSMIDHIDSLPSVRFAGLTTFPALLYDSDSGGARTTPNIATVVDAIENIKRKRRNLDELVVNAPGTTSSGVLEQLAEVGATQVEPGHGLTGTTPLHAVSDLPEKPAVCYLSEVAHLFNGHPYCFGGGLYVDPVFGDYQVKTIVAHEPSEVSSAPLQVEMPSTAAIDYYAKLESQTSRVVAEGASVVFGFRIQAFVTRAYVAGVSGVGSGNPEVAGIWDVFGNPVSWEGNR